MRIELYFEDGAFGRVKLRVNIYSSQEHCVYISSWVDNHFWQRWHHFENDEDTIMFALYHAHDRGTYPRFWDCKDLRIHDGNGLFN